jgi:hypothetical protein
MRNYPQEIEEQSIALTRLSEERDRAKEALEAVTDEIMREVLGETELTGKLRYTNDKARDLAIRDRCRNSPAWVEISERARLAEIARAASEAKRERLRGEFSESKLARRERIVNMEAAIN